MLLHLFGLSGGVETLTFQVQVFNTSPGAQQMLMYKKSYLIPIFYSMWWSTTTPTWSCNIQWFTGGIYMWYWLCCVRLLDDEELCWWWNWLEWCGTILWWVHRSQFMRLWYLLHRRPAKAQVSLRICTVSPEPSLFAHMKYGSRRRVRPKIRHIAPLSLRRTKSAIISWDGSYGPWLFVYSVCAFLNDQVQIAIMDHSFWNI